MSLSDDINNIDLSNIGQLPLVVKGMAFLLVFIAILIAVWWFDWSAQRDALTGKQNQVEEKLKLYATKHKQTLNLDALKEQMIEMEDIFGDMLRQLPDKTEVAGLLTDISQIGLATGLKFNKFEPRGEEKTEYYVSLPILISVKGSYHQFGEFISGLASLSRIVTIHNIKIGGGKDGVLKMDALARTYRAVSSEDEEG